MQGVVATIASALQKLAAATSITIAAITYMFM
jgi:hypothetical protein